MRRALALLAIVFSTVLSCLPAPVSSAQPAELTLARDFQADARDAAKKGLPILILYSLPGCPSCEVIRRSHLLPMVREGKANVIVRQVDLSSAKALKDFNGALTTHGAYAERQGIRFAPIVKLVGPDGGELAPPLTGTLLPDFYAAYLDDAIAAAQAKLKAAS